MPRKLLKKNLPPAVWTNFWNDLQVFIRKRNRFLGSYNPKKDIRPLLNVGVSDASIQTAIGYFQNFRDPLVFYKFSKFFRRDPDTVKLWANVATTDQAFRKLLSIFRNSDTERLRSQLKQVLYFNELNRKGEGRTYTAVYRGRGSIANIDPVKFSRLLNLRDESSKYKVEAKVKVRNAVVIVITKTGNYKVYKFIQLSRSGNKITIKISADSTKEYEIIKNAIRGWFQVYIDTPQGRGRFIKLDQFLRTGESKNFILTNVSYLQGEYKVTIGSPLNKLQNISSATVYKNQFRRKQGIHEEVTQFQLLHKNLSGRAFAFVSILSHKAGIIGAIVLNLNDRRLNSKERQSIIQDFVGDFGLSLNEFITTQDLSEEQIYKKLLENLPKKEMELDLRSPKSLEIYKQLLDKGLLPSPLEKTDQIRYCTNSSCRLSFQAKLKGKDCSGCGEKMLSGKKIVVEGIDEKKILAYLDKAFQALGYEVFKFERRLLTRKIYLLEVKKDDIAVEIIPVSKNLNDFQLDILRYRYPNLLIVSSKGNAFELSEQNLEAIDLFRLVFLLESKRRLEIREILEQVDTNAQSRLVNFSRESVSRMMNNAFYKKMNKESKNFGAELFEADCSILLSYIFGNSIWLGARTRGKALPDGLTAFPISYEKNGCFIWDSKYSEGRTPSLGKDAKNKRYIHDAGINPTVKENGGIKGFAFISNKHAPAQFVKKYKKLVQKKRVKITYIEAGHLLALFKHYKKYERSINGNYQIKDAFVNSMKQLLFNTAGNNKAFVLDAQALANLLKLATQEYKKIGLQTRVRAS